MSNQTGQTNDQIPLFGPDMLPDPYPVYHRLQAVDPVHWSEPFGAWILTRYDDVDFALREPRLSSTMGDVVPSSPETGSAGDVQGWQALHGLYAFVDNSLVFSDPPRHTRLRELVSKAFTPRAVETMRPHIQTLVDGLLDAVQAQRRMDLIRDLAYPLPLTVIATMLGVPLQDRDRIKQWCDDFLIPFGKAPAALTPEDRDRASQSGVALSRYVHALVEQVRTNPRNDLLTALEQAAEAGDRLTEAELFANVVLFLIAGHENTSSLLSLGTVALLDHPDQLQRVKDDPSLWPHAVEELLRYVTPNQFIRRRATEDVPLGGKTIRTGQSVLLILAAANRDPAHFPDPDRLDLGRPPARHLAFGHGYHFCLGAPLARLEAEIVFGTLVRRFPALRLATDHLEYIDNFNLRSLQSLPVTW